MIALYPASSRSANTVLFGLTWRACMQVDE
jgi:hypothetical protein